MSVVPTSCFQVSSETLDTSFYDRGVGLSESRDIRNEGSGYKLVANAVRARAEIDRRLQRRLAALAALVAVGAALIAAAVAFAQ